MNDDLGKLMDKFARARARPHTSRAKLFRAVQKVFETTSNPHAMSGVYNAAKSHSASLAKELAAAGAATDYTFPASEFATEVTRLRDQQRAEAKAKASGQGGNQQENNK